MLLSKTHCPPQDKFISICKQYRSDSRWLLQGQSRTRRQLHCLSWSSTYASYDNTSLISIISFLYKFSICCMRYRKICYLINSTKLVSCHSTFLVKLVTDWPISYSSLFWRDNWNNNLLYFFQIKNIEFNSNRESGDTY